MIRYSPLALAQLDAIWDYGFGRFGAEQADSYLDSLIEALDEVSNTMFYKGQRARLVPANMIKDVTTEDIYCFRYRNEVVYFKSVGAVDMDVICILGGRMDTPNRIKEILSDSLSSI